MDTCLHEVSFHLTRALGCAGGEYDNETRYVELLADIDEAFCDVRGLAPTPTYLDPDMAVGYPAGQAFSSELRDAGYNGIVYPSVRHRQGTCVVVFWPNLIQNFRLGAKWLLKWAGSPDPEIRKL